MKNKHPTEGHARNIVHQILCISTLKRNELKVYISLKESRWNVLQIAKVYFRYTIWFVLKNVLRGTCFFTVVVHACMKSQCLNKTGIDLEKKLRAGNANSVNP